MSTISTSNTAPTIELNSISGFIRSLWIIAQFELVRLFGTRQGLLLLFTFSVIWYLILTKLIATSAVYLQQNNSNNMSHMVLDSIGLGQILQWTVPEFGVYWQISIYLFPMFAVIFAADQTASDRDRGSLRFLTMRCSRDTIFFGRYLGQVLIQFLIILLTILSTFIIAVNENPSAWSDSIQCSLLIGTNLLLILMPYTAMMALLSAAVRSPIKAIIFAILLWTIGYLIIMMLANKWPALDFLKYLLPGTQHAALGELAPSDTLSLAYVPIFQTLMILSVGRLMMQKEAI